MSTTLPVTLLMCAPTDPSVSIEVLFEMVTDFWG